MDRRETRDHALDVAFETALESLLTHYRVGEESGTPNFILAGYVSGCLGTWKESVVAQNVWKESREAQERIEEYQNEKLNPYFPAKPR